MISSLNYELCRNTLFIFQIFMVFFQIYFCYKCIIVRQVVVWSLNHVRLFCDSINSNPPGFSVHGISKARILEWVATSFSKGSSQPRDWICISCIGRQILYHRAQGSLPLQEMQARSLGWEDPSEKETATHFSILAWRIPWTEKSGGLQSMGLRKSDMT